MEMQGYVGPGACTNHPVGGEWVDAITVIDNALGIVNDFFNWCRERRSIDEG